MAQPDRSPTPMPPLKWPPGWKPANLWWLMFSLVALFWMRDLWGTSAQVQQVPYSEFLNHLDAGRMESIAIGSRRRPGQSRRRSGAAGHAARSDAVAMADLGAAVERIVAGLERHRVLGDKERRTVAIHEMGHALVAMTLPGTDPVRKVSIIPRGIGALGYTLQSPSEDRYLAGRGELCNRLAVLLGGRAAEALLLGEVSTGAADDLVKASNIAHDMVARYGMAPEVGPVSYERQAPSRFLDLNPEAGTLDRGLSEATARRIDAAVRALVDEALGRATALLTQRRALLREGAGQLLAQETLTEAELRPLAEAARRVPDTA